MVPNFMRLSAGEPSAGSPVLSLTHAQQPNVALNQWFGYAFNVYDASTPEEGLNIASW
jgi:hypothetical protein